jgi:hypothetical protein
MKQLDIFEIEIDTITKNNFKTIKDKLSKYSIDKVYEKELKGQGSLLREIYERLSKQKDYELYMKDLINELLKIVPLVEQHYKFDKKGIFKYENGNYGFQMTKYIKDNLFYNGVQGPLYCLEMLPKIFFES